MPFILFFLTWRSTIIYSKKKGHCGDIGLLFTVFISSNISQVKIETPYSIPSNIFPMKRGASNGKVGLYRIKLEIGTASVRLRLSLENRDIGRGGRLCFCSMNGGTLLSCTYRRGPSMKSEGVLLWVKLLFHYLRTELESLIAQG